MNRRILGLLGVGAALVFTVAGCKGDPLSDADGSPAALVADFTYLQMAQGDSIGITASVVDGRSTPLEEVVTFSACDADVTVAPDPNFNPVPRTRYRATVAAVAPGASCVQIAGSGFTAQVDAVVLPTSFSGALSSVTPQGGAQLSIGSTAVLKFDTALVSVTFGGGKVAPILMKSADSLRVLVPFSSSAQLTIAGIDVTYVPGLRVTLQTGATVTQTGNLWAASSSWQTAPDISAILPAAGGSTRMIVTTGAPNAAVCPEVALGFGSSGPCMMFRYTVAAPTTLNFTTDWEGAALAPDVDVYVCSDSTVANFGAACFVDGGSGATGAKPQTTGNDVYAAGTYWFVIEVYDGTGAANNFITISRP